MANVFMTNMAINHFLWPFFAAFHRATPFQGMVQRKIGNNNKEEIPSIIKYKKY